MASTRFYQLKLFQALVTCALLWVLLSTDQLCGQLISPHIVLDSAAPTGTCSNYTLYQLELENATTTKQNHLQHSLLSVTHKQFADQLLDKPFPTGEHCFQVPIDDARHSWLLPTKEPFEMVTHELFFPLMFGILSLGLILLHAALQLPSKYTTAALAAVIFAAVIWLISFHKMAFLALRWCVIWHCTNFRPDKPFAILVTPLLAAILFVSCLSEVFYERELLKESSQKNHQQQTAKGDVNNKKGGGGEREFFTIDVQKF